MNTCCQRIERLALYNYSIVRKIETVAATVASTVDRELDITNVIVASADALMLTNIKQHGRAVRLYKGVALTVSVGDCGSPLTQ